MRAPSRQPFPSRLLWVVLAVVLMVAAPAACAQTENGYEAELAQLRQDLATEQASTTQELADALAAREDAELALAARLDDIEAALEAALEDDATAERLADVDADIGQLVDALSVLEADLAAGLVAERSARETLDANTAAANQEVRDSLAELRGSITSLRGEIALVSDAIEVLRDRVDRASGPR